MTRAIAAALAFVITAPAFAGDRVVKASNDPGLQELAYVFRIHNLSDDERDTMVRLFESGGGDPAMNGNRLLLAIVSYSDHSQCIWETGIDIYTVQSVALDAEKSEIAIEVTEHFQGDEGRIRERSRLYTISYDVDSESGKVSETIRVRKK
jgi:hypothetical protein